MNSSQDTFLVAAGQRLEDLRGHTFPSHMPLCDSSKCKKCKSKFLPGELDRLEEQHVYSSHSLQLGFERKYTFDMGRVGMQLSRLECQPHGAFWARENKIITFTATICCSILRALTASRAQSWTDRVLSGGSGRTYPRSGSVLSRKDSVASSCFTQKEGARFLSLWDKGGYTLATHEQGNPFIQGESRVSMGLINDSENE